MPTTQEAKIQFKPRSLSHEQRPDAPEGKWEAIIPKGKSKPCQTAPEKGGDPGILVMVKLEKADKEENESFQGAFIPLRIYFYDGNDSEKRRGANANLRTAMDLAEACELELSDVYPDEIRSEQDLLDIIDKLEGKRFDVWTAHRKGTMPNGDPTINVDLRFKEPGAGLQTRSASGDEDDKPSNGKAKTNGHAKTNGAAKRR
jgi:hypothetical protein